MTHEKTVNTVLKSCINFVWIDYLERTTPQILIMTRQQAFLNSDEVCFVNEISIELQPFNILNVHSEEIFLEICSCHLRWKLPWALRFWCAKRSHSCKYGNCSSVPFVCLFSFVWMFFSSSLSVVFLSAYFAPRGERWREGFALTRFYLPPYVRMGFSVLSATFAHYMTCSLSSLTLTRTQNQAVAAWICPEQQHSDYISAQN